MERFGIRKILFVELLGGIGDLLIALPAIQAIGRSYPQAKVTVMTFPPGGELLETDPLIYEVVYAKFNQAGKSVAELLASQRFDLIVSDTNYDGIEQLIQASKPIQCVTNLWRSPPAAQRVGDRFLQILLTENLIQPQAIEPSQLYLQPTEQHAAQQQLQPIHHPLVFLFPEAGMAIKCWSENNFVKLGQSLQQEYNATIIVPVGGSWELAARIATAIGGSARILPRGKLRNLAAAISQAKLVVAADTGAARIAATLGVPTITLFGPSWHERYGQPLPHINLQAYPECSERIISNFTMQPCWYGGVCPLEQWQTCMEEISPAQVLAATRRLISGRS